MKPPSTNGHDGGGRDGRGRFAKGNPGGPGNPLGAAVARLRAVLVKAVTPARMQKVADALLRLAENGDTDAARLLLSYTLGRPMEPDILERLERLENELPGGGIVRVTE